MFARLFYTQQRRLLASECCAVSDRDSCASATWNVKQRIGAILAHFLTGIDTYSRWPFTATVRRDKTPVLFNRSPHPLDRISRAALRIRVSLSLALPKFHSATTRLLQF